jgi:hypothetical protein
MASGRFAREKDARSYALSFFTRFRPHRRQRLAERLARRRFVLTPPAYVIVIEECDDAACLRSNGR